MWLRLKLSLAGPLSPERIGTSAGVRHRSRFGVLGERVTGEGEFEGHLDPSTLTLALRNSPDALRVVSGSCVRSWLRPVSSDVPSPQNVRATRMQHRRASEFWGRGQGEGDSRVTGPLTLTLSPPVRVLVTRMEKSECERAGRGDRRERSFASGTIRRRRMWTGRWCHGDIPPAAAGWSCSEGVSISRRDGSSASPSVLPRITVRFPASADCGK